MWQRAPKAAGAVLEEDWVAKRVRPSTERGSVGGEALQGPLPENRLIASRSASKKKGTGG